MIINLLATEFIFVVSRASSGIRDRTFVGSLLVNCFKRRKGEKTKVEERWIGIT
jgi:hypothetical protein